MQLSLKLEPFESKTASTKTELCMIYPLKVIRGHSFAINHRPTRSNISPYNIAGLLSEVSEEVATQIAKNCSRRQPHSHLGSPPRRPPRMCACTLYFQKVESLAYIFVADSVSLSLFKFVQWAPKDASFLQQSAFWPFKVVQGHPRSMILVPIESAFATSHYSVIVILS